MIRMGDTIVFRGSPRFVVSNYPSGLKLERIGGNRRKKCCWYSVSSKEKDSIVVVSVSTEEHRARARALLEADLLPHTRVEWDGDVPTYIHTIDGVEY